MAPAREGALHPQGLAGAAMSARFVVRIPGRRAFLRWSQGQTITGFVSRSDGTSGVDTVTTQDGPAIGGIVTYASREEAEALLKRCKASGGLATLVAQCVIEPLALEDAQWLARAEGLRVLTLDDVPDAAAPGDEP